MFGAVREHQSEECKMMFQSDSGVKIHTCGKKTNLNISSSLTIIVINSVSILQNEGLFTKSMGCKRSQRVPFLLLSGL